MKPGIHIREACVEDTSAIVEIMRDGFEASLLRMFIYGCEGIGRYIQVQIGLRSFGSDTVYTVAYLEERIVGCVELRRLRGELILNYISILSGFRSHGLGRSLLEFAIASTRTTEQTQISLDVFDQNVVARTWYEKLGFTIQSKSEWWDVAVASNGDDQAFLLSGYPQAAVCYKEFGFSNFRVTTPVDSYEIGCLGKEWFRIFQPEALVDPTLSTALLQLDPRRRFLAILKSGTAGVIDTGANARRVASSLRMRSGIDDLMTHLKQR